MSDLCGIYGGGGQKANVFPRPLGEGGRGEGYSVSRAAVRGISGAVAVRGFVRGTGGRVRVWGLSPAAPHQQRRT